MPNYGVPQAGGVLVDLRPGDSYYLFNAETPTPPQASVAFARGTSPGGSGGDQTTFEIMFGTAAQIAAGITVAVTAVTKIQGANLDTDAAYQDLWTSTNLQYDNFTDTTRWAFYRAKAVSQTGTVPLTVLVKR